jgi:small conductance mechanosensitive channel
MFETRSDAWSAVGLELKVDHESVRRAQRRLTLSVALLVATIFGYVRMEHHFTLVARYQTALATRAAVQRVHVPPRPANWYLTESEFRLIAVVLVIVLGWLISLDLVRIAPALFRRMDPARAGTAEFLIRLVTVTATAFGALAMTGISLAALAVAGGFGAVILGLAAQQTLGNLFAGMVLLTARPFRLGERIRLQAGAVGGFIEGIVSSLGLLYTTLARGEDRIMIPNNVVLAAAVVPLREPDMVDVKVRLSSGVRPTHVQAILDDCIRVPTRKPPSVLLEEIDGDEVVIRVQATPERHSEGAALADEIIAALRTVTGEHAIEEEPGSIRG